MLYLDDIQKVIIVLVVIVISLGVFIFVKSYIFDEKCCICGVYTNHCCPCPNLDHKYEVVEYFGYEPSSAGSWDYMCRTYKDVKNETFDCFE